MTKVRFKLGALVELKSGGPAMTVQKYVGEQVVCVWFEDKHKRSAKFEQESLQLAPSLLRKYSVAVAVALMKLWAMIGS